MTVKKHAHHLETSEIVQLLCADVENGLFDKEIKQRQLEHGLNTLSSTAKPAAWKKFLEQFQQPLVYILFLASLISLTTGEYVDASVIFAVIFINAIVGFIQETKAEEALKALTQLVVTETTVRRSGKKQRVPSVQLVPGDLVILESGDRVPADLRLFKAHNFQVDESSLTGESIPVHKHCDPLAFDTVLADRKNLAFAGTYVTTGLAEGLVWTTGDKTEMGRIAWLLTETTELSTPLTKKLQEFAKLLIWIILGFSTFAFGIGLLHGEKAANMFTAAVAIAVGAIPEGLPAAVTIVLSIGVARMAKRRAIVRKLPAVETLGSTTVICSDKTGTLTENQMTTVKVFTGSKLYDVKGTGYEPKGEFQFNGNTLSLTDHPALIECLRAGLLCNDAEILIENGHYRIQGDPTEAAMVVLAEKAGLLRLKALQTTPRIDVIPFDSKNMYRATLHETKQGGVIYKIGALERLLERCHDMLDSSGNIVPIDKTNISNVADTMASKGLRVLALARRHMDSNQKILHHEHVSSNLTFLGLQALIDPPRKDVITAIKRCQGAKIALKMVTGDHALTAKSIADQIGLEGFQNNGNLIVLTGRELEKLSDKELFEQIEHITVFARISPEQKLRIVKSLQARGHVVAMTGDGVNDAPALKQADIGVAMGISGTEVAKEAADIVLTDDNFATIEAAVEEGRGVFDNLTKFIIWTLPTNTSEALILFVAIVFGLTLPALPVQILWVNMVTAISLGLTLAFEPKEKDLMQKPPRDQQKPILNHEIFMRTGLVSLIILTGALFLFIWEQQVAEQSLAVARTVVINVIVFTEITYLFNCRSLTHSTAHIGFFSNKWAIGGSFFMIFLQLLFTYAPLMNKLFHSEPISLTSWLRIAAVASFAFVVVEFEKWCRFSKKTKAINPF